MDSCTKDAAFTKDWYVDNRLSRDDLQNRATVEAKFVELENRFKADAEGRDAVNSVEVPRRGVEPMVGGPNPFSENLAGAEKRRTQLCTEQAAAALAATEPRRSLEVAGAGPSLATPLEFAGLGPLSWERVNKHAAVKQALAKTLQAKWAEATTGPPQALPKTLDQGDDLFRQKLLEAQGRCKECKPLLEGIQKRLTATSRESVTAAEGITKDYRLNPEDGVLERSVFACKASIWVPVMPTTILPPEWFHGESREDLTWRLYAFERAHLPFLEPHRPSGNTWQVLKRIAFWPTMMRDFTIWMNNCAVCHQYRTVGVMAPMRSTLSSINEFAKLPWKDVIIDCQGPFTKLSLIHI